MTRKVIHVALNGVTGRMGYRQHLVRSLLAIREQGGVWLEDGTTLYPEPILVGRDTDRLRTIAERHGLQRWTDLHEGGRPRGRGLLRHPVHQREVALLKAIEAGKQCTPRNRSPPRWTERYGWPARPGPPGHHGVVHDSCSCPGLGEAVDLAMRFPADAVGVVVDTYHVWWDARLTQEIAGRRPAYRRLPGVRLDPAAAAGHPARPRPPRGRVMTSRPSRPVWRRPGTTATWK